MSTTDIYAYVHTLSPHDALPISLSSRYLPEKLAAVAAPTGRQRVIIATPASEAIAMSTPFANLPAPPYYAVVFSSLRRGGDDDGYVAAAGRMVELAREQPGFLGVESTRGAAGFGITVSYWESEEAIRAWRRHAEHAATRE